MMMLTSWISVQVLTTSQGQAIPQSGLSVTVDASRGMGLYYPSSIEERRMPGGQHWLQLLPVPVVASAVCCQCWQGSLEGGREPNATTSPLPISSCQLWLFPI